MSESSGMSRVSLIRIIQKSFEWHVSCSRKSFSALDWKRLTSTWFNPSSALMKFFIVAFVSSKSTERQQITDMTIISSSSKVQLMLELHNSFQDLNGFPSYHGLIPISWFKIYRQDSLQRKKFNTCVDCKVFVIVHEWVWVPLLTPEHHECDLDLIETVLRYTLSHQVSEGFRYRSSRLFIARHNINTWLGG